MHYGLFLFKYDLVEKLSPDRLYLTGKKWQNLKPEFVVGLYSFVMGLFVNC